MKQDTLAEETVALDVFLAAYAHHPGGEVIASVIDPTDDLLTLGQLRRILAALRTDGEANRAENITAPVSCTFGEMVEAAQESLTLEKAGICSLTTDGEANSPECPSCGGLNTSCPVGCGRDPKTGELDGTTLNRSVDGEANSRAVPSGEVVEDFIQEARLHAADMPPVIQRDYLNTALDKLTALSASKPDDASALLKEDLKVELAAAYTAGANDVHLHLSGKEVEREADFAEAASDYAEHALAKLDASIGRDGA